MPPFHGVIVCFSQIQISFATYTKRIKSELTIERYIQLNPALQLPLVWPPCYYSHFILAKKKTLNWSFSYLKDPFSMATLWQPVNIARYLWPVDDQINKVLNCNPHKNAKGIDHCKQQHLNILLNM